MDLEKLIPVLENEPRVWCLYLFGSRVRGSECAGSDVDLALMLDPKSGPGESWKVRLELSARFEELLGESVDLVVLGDDLDLTFRVLKEGRRVYVRDHDRTCEREATLLSRYYDFQPFLKSYLEKVAEEFRRVG